MSENSIAGARPASVEDEHLDYLDKVRATSVTNMGLAPQLLRNEFGLDKRDAREVAMYWMNSFGKRDKTRATGVQP